MYLTKTNEDFNMLKVIVIESLCNEKQYIRINTNISDDSFNEIDKSWTTKKLNEGCLNGLWKIDALAGAEK